MEEIIKVLKSLPKEFLQAIILELMKDNKLSFTDIAETHVKYLEMLRKGQSEKLMHLRSKVIALWCGTKKSLPESLTALITEGMNEGWVNITQEQIDKSKWNK